MSPGTVVFLASVVAFARVHAVGAVIFVGVATLAAVSIRVASAVVRRQLRTIDVIAGGLEHVPSSHVRRVRARLLSRRQRERMAHGLETYVPVAAGAQDELRAVIALLRDGAPSEARGVALCHQLLWDYPSPLHGDAPTALRAELGRIRFLLAG